MAMEDSGGGVSSGDEVVKPSCPRGHWRPAEDERLRKLVQQYGPQNWNSIAEKLQGRSGKSCRLRWFNQLDPRINRKPFTEEEEERLLAAHRIHGNKWALISRLFPGRTDNAVKNHWHVIMARKQREQSKRYTKRTSTAPSTSNQHRGLDLFLSGQAAAASRSMINVRHSGVGFGPSKDLRYWVDFPVTSSSSSTPSAIRPKFKGVTSTSPFGFYGFHDRGNHDRVKCTGTGEEEHQGGGRGEEELIDGKKDVEFIDFLGVGVTS